MPNGTRAFICFPVGFNWSHTLGFSVRLSSEHHTDHSFICNGCRSVAEVERCEMVGGGQYCLRVVINVSGLRIYGIGILLVTKPGHCSFLAEEYRWLSGKYLEVKEM